MNAAGSVWEAQLMSGEGHGEASQSATLSSRSPTECSSMAH